MHFFHILEDTSLPYKGEVDAINTWSLPGVHCPACDAIWSSSADAWPGVDLSHLAPRDLKVLAEPHLEENFVEYERLVGLVRPLLPGGTRVHPGTAFGPLVGTAHGTFPAFYMPYSSLLLARRDTLERLAPEGLRGVQGFPTELRFRKKHPPELLELQVEPHGQLHADCLPPERRTPCPTCGRWGFTLPDDMLLDGRTLPPRLDVFRVGNAPTVIAVTERFQQAVQRLGLDGLVFHELPVR